jgi:hypothetical protein
MFVCVFAVIVGGGCVLFGLLVLSVGVVVSGLEVVVGGRMVMGGCLVVMLDRCVLLLLCHCRVLLQERERNMGEAHLC